MTSVSAQSTVSRGAKSLKITVSNYTWADRTLLLDFSKLYSYVVLKNHYLKERFVPTLISLT